jgi:hypothetical protein
VDNEDAEAIAYARRVRERRALPGGTSTLGFALGGTRLGPPGGGRGRLPRAERRERI